MERESRKRVKIEQRPKSKPLKSRLNFTKDPPLVSSSARKRKAVRSPSPDSSYYGIRSIKKERRIKGKLQYLIDWTNNPVTNEVYPESWVCCSFAAKGNAFSEIHAYYIYRNLRKT